jgi:hypothetical protein
MYTINDRIILLLNTFEINMRHARIEHETLPGKTAYNSVIICVNTRTKSELQVVPIRSYIYVILSRV